MCNRNEIVTNGCSGACCECFTLPVTIKDMQKMKAKLQARIDFPDEDSSYERVLCEDGIRREPNEKNEIDKLLDMLIPLGDTTISPQDGISLNEVYHKAIEDGIVDLEKLARSTNDHFQVNNNIITAHIFTCKYFDKENKLCTNYDNRPHLCKKYGSACSYKGCEYPAKAQKDREDLLAKISIRTPCTI